MKKELEKGQVSVFVIIAVVIVLGIILIGFFAFTNKSEVKKFIDRKSVSSELLPVYDALSTCSSQRVIDAIRIVGLQGGYVNLPKDYLVTDISNVGYGYYKGKNTLLKKEDIEKEISSYVEFAIQYCINDVSFPGLNISFEKASAVTNINKDFVFVSAKIPASIIKENKVFNLDKEYQTQVYVNLGNMLDVANNIIKKQSEEPNYIPISYLAALPFYVAVIPYSNSSFVYYITDKENKTLVGGSAYTFMFAGKK